jgi:transcriptional regulator GlxA family with amidase domain
MVSQRHGFLLLPRFSLLALSGALEALAAANELLAENPYGRVLLSLTGEPVRAACGTTVACAHAVGDAPLRDAVFVVS